MFVLTILEKFKETRLKFSHGSTKLANTQLSKLKAAAKNKTGTKLRITEKNFQDKELPYELL